MSRGDLPGGGTQNGTLGILQYKSQSDDNTGCLTEKDDLSIQTEGNIFIQCQTAIQISNHFQTQEYLKNISEYTTDNQM